MVVAPQLTPKDYASDQNVRWCPGCELFNSGADEEGISGFTD